MFIIDGIKVIFKLIIVFIIFIGLIAYWLVDLVFNFSGRDIEGTDADYVESYFIIAKDVDNDKIRYYEVNGKGNKRSADKFESEKFDEVVDLDRCFESYIDRDKNKVLNKYLDNCYMINQNGEDLSNESIYQDIAIQVSLLEHDMFDIKIYKIGDEYYVTRGLNVNLYVPYDLFKYDIENNKLIRIYQTNDEEIIGFKKKRLENDTKELILNVKSNTLTNKGATFILKNNSADEYSYDDPYIIEKLENGNWKELDTLTGNPLSWNDMLHNLKPHEEREIKIDWSLGYGELKSGTYRLVKSNLRKANSPESRLYSFYVEFDIK